MPEPHFDAQIVYVIPEVTEDPLKDDTLSLEQIAKLINQQNEILKQNFKKFAQAPANSEEKTEMQQKLNESKQRLNEFLQKEKQIKIAYSKKKNHNV